MREAYQLLALTIADEAVQHRMQMIVRLFRVLRGNLHASDGPLTLPKWTEPQLCKLATTAPSGARSPLDRKYQDWRGGAPLARAMRSPLSQCDLRHTVLCQVML